MNLIKTIEEELANCRAEWAAYEKASNEYNRAWEERKKATVALPETVDTTWVAYEKALGVHQEELERLHRQDWPGTAWNGQSIFAK